MGEGTKLSSSSSKMMEERSMSGRAALFEGRLVFLFMHFELSQQLWDKSRYFCCKMMMIIVVIVVLLVVVETISVVLQQQGILFL